MKLNSVQAAITEHQISINGKTFLRRQSFLKIHGIIPACSFDVAFQSTPAPFTQCIIVMVYGNETDLYVPCIYALLTGKNECYIQQFFRKL
ncbi:hypothetical protein HZS_7240 [Henneguya salminicola]|nr:hypothetical protein HZS_7240 [Henneguya salminicola]